LQLQRQYFFTPGQSNKPDESELSIDYDVLDTLRLDDTVEFARLDIAVVQSAQAQPESMKQLNVRLPAFTSLTIKPGDAGAHHRSSASVLRNDPVTVQVPPIPPEVDASHIMIGMATSVGRLSDSLDSIAHWASNTKVRLFALVEPDENAQQLQNKFTALGIDIHLSESTLDISNRYFSLIQFLYGRRDKHTQWAGIVDDDTFFVSMENLVHSLSQYDATKPHYVGGLTEHLEQMWNWSFMGYGGAGIFLSTPLLSQLQEFYEKCNEGDNSGDRKIAKCVYQHTTTKLTVQPDLYQMDLHNDISGILESGRSQPLSIHHWKSWNNVNVLAMGTVASVAGDASLLQRWRFSDDWILVNGYSLIKYSSSFRQDDIAIEHTWTDSGTTKDEHYEHTIGPLQPVDKDKISFRLDLAVQKGPAVHQYYVRRNGSGLGVQVFMVVWQPA
jgi:hypothetical protein